MSAPATDPARHRVPLRWTALLIRILTRRRTNRDGRARIRALLARGDDHLIDDTGMTRDELRERFGLLDGL